MKKHVLNIEGIPGSGKSTAAAQVDRLFRANSIDSYWVWEEDPNDPIGTSRLSRTVGVDVLASRYLDSWKEFVRRNRKVAILDGYALQSSVRFLFALNAPQSTISSYFSKWQKITQFGSSMVYLKVEDPAKHFSDFVFPLRGEEWRQKVSSYVSATPLGRERGLEGSEGLIEFWSEYQTVCLELLCNSVVPIRIQNYADRSWIEESLEFTQYAARVKK